MDLHRQPCPACHRELELPAAAKGRLAKCPACDATFRIGEEGGATDAAGGEPSINPYQASAMAEEPPIRLGELEIVQRPIEDIVSPTLAIFTARWAPLIVATLIVIGVMFAVFGIPVMIIVLIANVIGEAAAGLLSLLLFPLLVLASCYTTVGYARVSLAVARNQPSPLKQLLPPLHLVWRFSAGMLILLLGLGGVGLLGMVVAVGLAVIDGGEVLVAIFTVFASIVGFVLVLGLQWLLWPWVFVVSDEKASALQSLRVGCQIALSNKWTSALIVIIATVLSTAGSAACYVGQIVTTPLTLLLFAVGYLLLTRQAIDDPKAASSPAQPPMSSPLAD